MPKQAQTLTWRNGRDHHAQVLLAAAAWRAVRRSGLRHIPPLPVCAGAKVGMSGQSALSRNKYTSWLPTWKALWAPVRGVVRGPAQRRGVQSIAALHSLGIALVQALV